MYGKKQWRGREVEGRYSDIMTYFVRELSEEDGIEDFVGLYPHFYFTIEYVTKMINPTIGSGNRDRYMSAIRTILDNTFNAVTIEANAETLKNEAIKLGITDAFITVYKDGKKIYGAEATNMMIR